MAGLYLHIPFCKQACYYCDFHFSTNQSRKTEMINALIEEMSLQREYLGSEKINTIYFGGGTPSLLNEKELDKIMSAIAKYFVLDNKNEITLEANPDDLTLAKLQMLKDVGINRLSIGIQSFNNDFLQYMNRAHDSDEAVKCIENAKKTGFDNFSLDLIYAIPADDHSHWYFDLEKAMSLEPNHISAYCLTIEPKTVFGIKNKKGNLKLADEEFAARQFEILVETLSNHDYLQYEISNFCKEGYHSKHNTNYWLRAKYLGIGPSAHSYDGSSRQFNISHNQKYLSSIAEKKIPAELEILSRNDHVNEYILTNLRTVWGVDNTILQNEYSYDLLLGQQDYLRELLIKELIVVQNQSLVLTDKGKLLADQIASDLLIVE